MLVVCGWAHWAQNDTHPQCVAFGHVSVLSSEQMHPVSRRKERLTTRKPLWSLPFGFV